MMIIFTDLLHLLRMFSLRRNSPQVTLIPFQDYLHRYARHFLQQKPELAVHLEISLETLLSELKKIQDEGNIEITTDKSNTTIIFVPYYHVDNIARQYASLEQHPDIPFPLLTDLPRNFPGKLLKAITISDDIAVLNPESKENSFLYALNYNGDIPPLIFPGSYKTDKLLNLALDKIKLFLSKDESRDYMQKRLIIANPGKEFTVKTFISKTMAHSVNSFQNVKESGDNYILWGQLCAFIKQEFAKKNEKLPDEIALLQAAGILEYLNNYYRNRAQKDIQTDTALKNLLLALQKPPYYFTMKQITKFTDSRGVPLLGQYSEETLQNFMKEKTSTSEKYIIPDILTFANSSNDRFYLLTEKVVPLLISLINEARKPVREICIKKWHEMLINFEQDSSMKNDAAFNELLKEITAHSAPNLYGLLNASFILSIIADPRLNEIQAMEINRIFPAGKPAAYHEILMLNRYEILSDTKILLPFWYTIPIISSIIAFFKKKRKKPEPVQQEKKEVVYKKPKQKLRDVAEKVSISFIPEGMTLDQALEKTLDEWNHTLGHPMRENLTEDVNALIRDYLRGINRTISVAGFTADRVRGLAKTLAESPGLLKIKDRKALQNYIELYILKLVSQYS
ncbi:MULTISPECIES: hypothetical protein [unclassified Treponema]|uniref:hypothetical protein n=1 Tax=unclassified Treponema TaxID=2638727 RepID=UPI0020A54FC9|nr:hypothetical protein [Treponema sp. OMZ 789]UTC66552.1 hypothetical protein E4O06_11390 [Treponema sp. OMZ 789]UTC69284.1 hypothetical protein E4O01_11530 [Treponema sp. OMZ 790]UTC71998.1 hypothetical protein E4O02_11625 [Treponema sp. OMZ 791]